MKMAIQGGYQPEGDGIPTPPSTGSGVTDDKIRCDKCGKLITDWADAELMVISRDKDVYLECGNCKKPDLVQTLRHLGSVKTLSGHAQSAQKAMIEAAGEIEELRLKLAKVT